MPTIGTRAHAKELIDYRNKYGWGNFPSTFREIGAGSFRTVYLHLATNVVYKVEDYSEMPEYANKRELHNIRRMRSGTVDGWVTPHLRIPAASGYTFDGEMILAMEYVSGSTIPVWAGEDVAPEGRVALYFIGRFDDMHGKNFMVQDDNTIVPVDLASPRRRTPKTADMRVLAGLSERDSIADMYGITKWWNV